LTAKEVCRGLKVLGFVKRQNKATSHQQWVKDGLKNGKPFRWKVTVDKHHAPFHKSLLASMIHQSGVSKKAFYAACLGRS
jgi:predicted RNA binding protein YcfA (HicA-like mRNA interferase family)